MSGPIENSAADVPMVRVEDPWTESTRLVRCDDPRLVRNCVSSVTPGMDSCSLPPRPQDVPVSDLSSIIRSPSFPLDREQVRAIDICSTARDSSAIQARTGAGKTLIASYVAAANLLRDPAKHVIFCAPTNFIVEQTVESLQGESGLFLNSEATTSSTMGASPAKRASIYSLESGRLIVGSASAFAKDLGVRLSPERISLVIIDEAHLMRGSEAAAVVRDWCIAHSIPVVLCSATLTKTQKPALTEIVNLMDENRLARFVALPNRYTTGFVVTREKQVELASPAPLNLIRFKISDLSGNNLPGLEYPKEGNTNFELSRGANYTVPDPQYLELDDYIATQASLVAREMLDITHAIHEQLKRDEFQHARLPDPLRVGRLSVERIIKGLTSRSHRFVPGAPEILHVAKSLASLAKRSGEIGISGKTYSDLTRDAFTLLSLSHIHLLTTTQPRVGVLEYAGRLLFQCRTGTAKPHHFGIFPPGRPPKWWLALSDGTPYQLLNTLLESDATARPLMTWLKERGANPADTDDAKRLFFSSERVGLGFAATDLSEARFIEHPKVSWVLNSLSGSVRRKNPGQALVYCAEIIPTLYLSFLIERRLKEKTVPLVGNKALSAKVRRANRQLAMSGEASVACCTSVGELGVNIKSLKWLLMLEGTADLQAVEQRFGRVGRIDGSRGVVLITGTRGYRDAIRDLSRQQQQIAHDVLPPGQTRRGRVKPSDGPSLFDQVSP